MGFKNVDVPIIATQAISSSSAGMLPLAVGVAGEVAAAGEVRAEVEEWIQK